jgi:hypothetical protein
LFEGRLMALSKAISSCLKIIDFAGVGGSQNCVRGEIAKFDTYRKSLALEPGGRTSLVQKVTAEVKSFPVFKVVTAGSPPSPPPVQVPFWQSPLPAPLSPFTVAVAHSFGSWIRSSVLMGSPHKKAHLMLNQHYYVRALLDVIGTADGKAILSKNFPTPTDIAGIAAYDVVGGNDFQRMHVLLRPLLEGLDDNKALMVQARRIVNDNYHHFVANAIAQTIYNDVVKKLYENVVRPFWSLPVDELKKFQEIGAPGSPEAARKGIWDAMSRLTALVSKLASELDRDFVQQGDGNAAAIDPMTTGMADVREAYSKLYSEIGSPLDDSFEAAAFTGLDANLVNKIQNIRNAGTTLWDNMSDLENNLKPAFDTAYDLHQFNYFKMDRATPLNMPGGPLREYPDWHSKYDGTAPHTPITHPLEP